MSINWQQQNLILINLKNIKFINYLTIIFDQYKNFVKGILSLLAMSSQQLFRIIQQCFSSDNHFSSVQSIMQKFPQYDRKAISFAMLQTFKKNIENRDIAFFAVLNVTENGRNKLNMKFMSLKDLNRDMKLANIQIKPVQLNTVAIFADQAISLKEVVQKLSNKRKICIGKQSITQSKFQKNTDREKQIDKKTVKNNSIKAKTQPCEIKTQQFKVQALPRKHPTKPNIKQQLQKENVVNRRKMSSSDEQYFDPDKPENKAHFDKLLNGTKTEVGGKMTPDSKIYDDQRGIPKTQQPRNMDIQEDSQQQQDQIQKLIAQAKKKKQLQKNEAKKMQPVAPKNPKMQNGTLNAFIIKK